MMKFKLFDWLLKDYEMPEKYKLIVYDEYDNEYCLVGLCSSLSKEVLRLGKHITTLEQKCEGALVDIKRLEEENAETNNCLYELMENIRALDARIDIVGEHCGITEDV